MGELDNQNNQFDNSQVNNNTANQQPLPQPPNNLNSPQINQPNQTPQAENVDSISNQEMVVGGENVNTQGPFQPECLDEPKKEYRGLKNSITTLLTLNLFSPIIGLIVLISIPYVLSMLVGDISFIYKIAPLTFWLTIPISVYAAYNLYLIFKLRKMTKMGFYLTWGLPILSIIYAFCINLGLNDLINGLNSIVVDQQKPTVPINASILVGSVSIFIIATLTLLVINRKKLKDEKERISRGGLIFSLIFSFTIIIGIVTYVGNAFLGINEQPFIGASKAEGSLSENPVYFEYIPSQLEQTAMIRAQESDSNFKIAIDYSNPNNVMDFDNKMVVYQNVDMPNINDMVKESRNGEDYYYLLREKETLNPQMLVFKEGNVWVTIIAINNTSITKNELYKIAESATQ